MFGAYGRILSESCISFVSQAAMASDIKHRLHLHRQVLPVSRTRQLTKADMLFNGAMPHIEVNPETFEVMINGVKCSAEPTKKASLAQLYFFS